MSLPHCVFVQVFLYLFCTIVPQHFCNIVINITCTDSCFIVCQLQNLLVFVFPVPINAPHGLIEINCVSDGVSDEGPINSLEFRASIATVIYFLL